MPRIIDVSLGISPDMLTWPTDPAVKVEPAKRRDRGDSSNVSELRMGSHTGTHIDPPWHFVDGGATVDQVPLDALVGEAVVADLGDAEEIGPPELEGAGLPEGTERLLCRTRNSDLWAASDVDWPERYVAVTEEGARWITERGIRLVGVDFLSVEIDGKPDHPVHTHLLESGTVIVEGLNLGHVEPGTYTLCCLPLRILGGDGAPARAILLPS